METIGTQKIWSILSGQRHASETTCRTVRHDSGYEVDSFLELATRVAELQFMNRDYVLLFRGQSGDYLNNDGNTSLKPSLLRPRNSLRLPTDETLANRFEKLERAERMLVRRYEAKGWTGLGRLKRQRILRWAILQHYEVCSTPLLDVTHSLRIAASFASHSGKSEVFIFVLGVPNLSGAITASAEAGLQIVRLSSVCPPTAIRPHIQEGYLLGEYPEIGGSEQKALYNSHEMDFGRRLIAKFRFNPEQFWENDDDFPIVTQDALYPAEDPLRLLTKSISARLNK